MNPGDTVTATQDIRVGPRVILAGTVGIVEWADGAIACVQFAGHLRQPNVPCAWLRPVRLAVANVEEVCVD